ncbi:MAG: hypothetical protein PHU85_02165 [Phycisphaerae bacterium]|nr:hypothetical protein [Phycisphaerae bacterium]
MIAPTLTPAPPLRTHQFRKRAIKHCSAVYPLEGYGILLGLRRPLCFIASLPVGRTERWESTDGRFANIADAIEKAGPVARQHGLEVVGLYHDNERTVGQPERDRALLAMVPKRYRDLPVMILYNFGGNEEWTTHIHCDGHFWDGCELPQLPLPKTRRFNRRRIHSAWLKAWGPINYDNNWRVELRARAKVSGKYDAQYRQWKKHDLKLYRPTFYEVLDPADELVVWEFIEDRYLSNYARFVRVEFDYGSTGLWDIPFPGSVATGACLRPEYLGLPADLVSRLRAWHDSIDLNIIPERSEEFDWTGPRKEGLRVAKEIKRFLGDSAYVEYHLFQELDVRFGTVIHRKVPYFIRQLGQRR